MNKWSWQDTCFIFIVSLTFIFIVSMNAYIIYLATIDTIPNWTPYLCSFMTLLAIGYIVYSYGIIDDIKDRYK
jgi:hypothetical protein